MRQTDGQIRQRRHIPRIQIQRAMICLLGPGKFADFNQHESQAVKQVVRVGLKTGGLA